MYASVSSYSYSGYTRAGKMTQFDTIAKSAELGFSAIEFTDLEVPAGATEEEYAKKFAAEAKRCGLRISSYTTTACLIKDTLEETKAEIERVKHKVEIAAILGAPVMRHDAYFAQNRYPSFDQSLPELADNIREISEYGKTLGVKTSVENHGTICQDSDRMERLFNAVHCDNFGLLVDIGNFMCVDEEPYLAVGRVAPYAVHVHAKDFMKYGFEDEPLQQALITRGGAKIVPAVCGTGYVPLTRCLSILKRAGYDGSVSIEYEGTLDCIAALTAGLQNLNTAFSRI